MQWGDVYTAGRGCSGTFREHKGQRIRGGPHLFEDLGESDGYRCRMCGLDAKKLPHKTARCGACLFWHRVRLDGNLMRHQVYCGSAGRVCGGSYKPPLSSA